MNMRKLDLEMAAGEFDMISSDTHLFYNLKTGEFDFYNDFTDAADTEKFDEDDWIAAPSQWDINEYDLMVDFADTVADPRKSELLSVALNGKGAFRRFKDTLYNVGLDDEWFAFKRKAYIRIARKWCEENGIEYAYIPKEPEIEQPPAAEQPPTTIAVTMATLESHNHIVGDIERGVKVYNQGGVEWQEDKTFQYLARVPHKGDSKTVTVAFNRDGTDIKHHFCNCSWQDNKPPICRHVVAAVLAIQGGIVESKLKLGKTATVSAVVSENNTAEAVGSGSLDVFATPMMITLMEQAACECLADALAPEQTSVGTEISISHTAASPIGAEITATATIEYVFGYRIEFIVTASDKSGEIGKGKHTRVIVDTERFMKKAAQRL